MRTSTITLATLLAIGRLAAQPTPAVDTPEPAEIHGTVRSITGEPIPRATVRIRTVVRASLTSDLPSAVTGEAGDFILTNLPPGNYIVSASRPGYLTQSYGVDRPQQAPRRGPVQHP